MVVDPLSFFADPDPDADLDPALQNFSVPVKFVNKYFGRFLGLVRTIFTYIFN